MTPARRPRASVRLVRERLLPSSDDRRRVSLVVGPPGSGKTALLQQLEERAGLPVVKCSASEWGGDIRVMLQDLQQKVAAPGAHPWRSAGDAVAWLHRVAQPLCVSLDDLHELGETPAERELLEIVRRGPDSLTLLLASRTVLRIGATRLRACDDLYEVTPDDLRFRSWEVERLFRDVYGEALPAPEVAELTRRTGGWAACLHLFHLAAGGETGRSRGAALSAVEGSPTAVAAYLGRRVLDGIAPGLSSFLRSTSVLPVLAPGLCDELLGRDDSGEALTELAHLGLVVESFGGGSWRCTEPLHGHLRSLLVEEVGEDEARAGYVRAAEVLERHGMPAEALRAQERAGAWREAHRLAWRHARELGEGGRTPPEPAPRTTASRDPWLLLGTARWFRARGRPLEAIDAYRRAEREFGPSVTGRECRRERAALACWVEPVERPSDDWAGSLRAALTDGVWEGRATSGSAVHARLVEGVSALARGDPKRAVRALRTVAESASASPATSVAARVALAAALLLAGDAAGEREAERAAGVAAALQLSWLVRAARAVLALSDDPGARLEAASAKAASDDAADAPGSIVAAFLLGLGALRYGDDARSDLDEAAALARCLGLGVVESWARAARCLAAARAGERGAYEEALSAEAAARRRRSPGGRVFALLAAAEASGDASRAALARSIAAEHSLALPLGRSGAAPPRLRIRCFGGLSVEVDGSEASLAGLRPRTRQLLRLLLIYAPQPVHREVLMEALWPHLPEARAASSLHVAVSSLRQALDAVEGPGLTRDGDAYALDLASAEVDLVEYRKALAEGKCSTALDLYRGELFPEEGPAEWVVGPRAQMRDRAVRAAHDGAHRLLSEDPTAAAALCQRGLELDRDADALWRMLVDAHRRAGNPAAAARATLGYRAVLEGLGVPAHAAG